MWQSTQVGNMKLLVMLCFIAFHIETLHCGQKSHANGSGHSCHTKKSPSLRNSQRVAQKKKDVGTAERSGHWKWFIPQLPSGGQQPFSGFDLCCKAHCWTCRNAKNEVTCHSLLSHNSIWNPTGFTVASLCKSQSVDPVQEKFQVWKSSGCVASGEED